MFTLQSNQKSFPEHFYACMRGLCRSGNLGDLELITLYAFRDGLGRIETGM